MHCAMSAFEKTIVHPKESNVNHPSINDVLRIGVHNRVRRTDKIYVTKRGYGWFQEPLLNEFCDDALAGGYGVIYMVRDPADVLTSVHKGESERRFYLEPQRWSRSIRAGERLTERLSGKVPFLIVRYEDLVRHPEETRDRVESTFGLRLQPKVESWANLDSNVAPESLGDLATALHSIRSFDVASIGKWKVNPELADYWQSLLDSDIATELARFGQTYGYDIKSLTVGQK